MKNERAAVLKIVHSEPFKSIRTSVALILTMFMVVFAAATIATAQTYADLYNFDGAHGGQPDGILSQGRDGNLYGTTSEGGTIGYGVVFKITLGGKEKVLYSFDGVHGIQPYSGLTLGTDGNFYGTTSYGGSNSCYPENCGTIFKTTQSGSLTTLYSFTGGADGSIPYAAPIEGNDGIFYGTTEDATSYKITSSGSFTVLSSFQGADQAPLLQATDGNFYGTIWAGGLGKQPHGALFRMTPKGIMRIIHTFHLAPKGQNPNPVIQGSDGNFYGTTANGGGYHSGVVFKSTLQGATRVLHIFSDPNYPNDGRTPIAGLVQATDGNFYGTTHAGGTLDNGVIFQITPAGDYSIVYNFDGLDGAGPESTLMQHTNGKVYGLTYGGGTHSDGVVYSFDMGLGPFVRLVSTTGKVGKTVEVLGQGFTGTTAVSFNGTAASFTVAQDTYLTTTVPSGATTGFVTVTTPSGTLKSNQQFRVKP